MPRTFLIRSNSTAVQEPDLSTNDDCGDEKSSDTIVQEEGSRLIDDMHSENDPIDLSISRSVRVRTTNNEKSSPEIRGYRAGQPRTGRQSCNIREVINGEVSHCELSVDESPLPSRNGNTSELHHNVINGKNSQSCLADTMPQHFRGVSFENRHWSNDGHPFQNDDVHMEADPSQYVHEPVQSTSGITTEDSSDVRRFTNLSKDRLFSLNMLEDLTQMVEDETEMQPSRSRYMSLLEAYYAEAVAKRNIIRDLRRELQLADLSELDDRGSVILPSRRPQHLSDMYSDDSLSRHTHALTGPTEDIYVSPISNTHPPSRIDHDLGRSRIKQYLFEECIPSSRNRSPMDQSRWNGKDSIGSKHQTPRLMTTQSSPHGYQSSNDPTVQLYRRLPLPYPQSLPPRSEDLTRTHMIQQHPHPTTTQSRNVPPLPTEPINMNSLEEYPVLKDHLLQKSLKFLHPKSTALSGNSLEFTEVPTASGLRPSLRERPQSSVQTSDEIPSSSVYEAAVPCLQNLKSCQGGQQDISRITPSKVGGDQPTPTAYDSAPSSSNNPTTHSLPTPPTCRVGERKLSSSFSAEGPQQKKSYGSPDSTSFPDPKPLSSVAGDAPSQSTPTHNSKHKLSCSLCLSSFPTEKAYAKHMAADHNQMRPHICGFCGKGFQDKFDLKRHYRTHTGIRPYKCTICPRAFTQRCSLETHVNKVHDMPLNFAFKERRKKIYVCEDCGHSVNQPFDHYLHMWTAHSRLVMPKRLRHKVMNRIKYILKSQNGGCRVGDELLADPQVVTQSICSLRELI